MPSTGHWESSRRPCLPVSTKISKEGNPAGNSNKLQKKMASQKSSQNQNISCNMRWKHLPLSFCNFWWYLWILVWASTAKGRENSADTCLVCAGVHELPHTLNPRRILDVQTHRTSLVTPLTWAWSNTQANYIHAWRVGIVVFFSSMLPMWHQKNKLRANQSPRPIGSQTLCHLERAPKPSCLPQRWHI